MKLQNLEGIITNIWRLNCSAYGNPRFNIEIDNDLVLTTKSDYSYCYNIENLFNKQCVVSIEYYETKTGYRIQTIKEKN